MDTHPSTAFARRIPRVRLQVTHARATRTRMRTYAAYLRITRTAA